MKWQTIDDPQVSYDLVVYRGIKTGYGYLSGEQVYYREHLREGSHRIDQALEPKTVYVWSVRTRKGDNVSSWSTYDFHRGLKGVLGRGYPVQCNNWWWTFRTPGN
jgi:hypothetical protein